MAGGRPPYVPAQEDVKDTYMDPQYIPCGDYTVAQINPGSLESNVCEAWTLILKDVFSIYQGFMVNHDADVQGQKIDMEVCHLKNHRRLNFLALVLKRYSSSNSDQAMADAETQLKGHLESLGHTQEGRLWSALCIGKGVRIYRCSKESGKAELFALHDGVLRIDRQPQTVKQWLQHIRSIVMS
ncbi:uncharacterized protein FSUBG_7364 [Fusarium subglutinans]|uniref:Uncharacterized protein n=1 Tax=Gibberella subglutinans TaxID=42677 RepID=A0A8H5PVV4_GIBSU|nr:uncharacterized protein FSUBG_7364 [Fusarium subglutinans]KAF5603141.1 hypothetical protein FSUBG_7364 [Fusarium subglutinans]